MGSSLRVDTLVVGPIQTNCYIVRREDGGGRAVLIDPGDEPRRIIKTLTEMKAEPEAILLTHGHYDHILAVNELRERWPSLKAYISRGEQRMTEDESYNSGFGESYSWKPDHYLEEGEELDLLSASWKILSTPGHTEGSVCYYLPDEHILFSGDTLFYHSYGRYDLPTGSWEQLAGSLRMLLTALPEETAVFPGHGSATTIQSERRVFGFA